MPYLLDADTLIRAKNDHYGFALCPGFWEWLVRTNLNGTVFSVEAIFDDLKKYTRVEKESPPDELGTWARNRGLQFFLEPTASTHYAMEDVAAWARSARYRDSAVREFLDASDSWLVAEGRSRHYTVVTHEVSSPDAVKRIKIPDACAAQSPSVECITPFEMLRREKAVFVLGEAEAIVTL